MAPQTRPVGNGLEISRIYAVSLAGCLAIPFPSILAASLLIPLFVLILVHWNLNHLACELLEPGSPFCVALPDSGCNPQSKISPGGVRPAVPRWGCSPSAPLILAKRLWVLLLAGSFG